VYATFFDTLYLDFGNPSSGGRINVNQPPGWDDSLKILRLRRDGNTGTIAVNGSVLLTGAFTDTLNAASGTLSIGGANLVAHLKGYISYVIVFDYALDAEQDAAMMTYLTDRYGL
jgi:hypothetical protein